MLQGLVLHLLISAQNGAMGTVAPAGEIALVIPGYFICTGVLLYTAIVAAAMGIYRARAPTYLSFAAVCLCSAGFTATTATYYLADSEMAAVEALRWQFVFGAPFALSMFAFVAHYTEARRMERWFAFFGGLTVVFLIANFLLPYGVRFSSITAARHMTLAWGESIYHLEGVPGAWHLVFRVLTLALLVWSLRRLAIQYRANRQREAVVLAVYLVGLVGASAQGALIDVGVLQTFNWLGFALGGLAVIMGLNLLLSLREQNVALIRTAYELQKENERRREAEAETWRRAYRDPLTGLANRMLIVEQLGLMCDGASDSFGAVLYLNLDHFKVLNDGLSHGVGDAVLREVARRVVDAANDRALVARVGGDEFVVVLHPLVRSEEAAAAAVERMASDLAQRLSEPLRLDEQMLGVSASMGIATFAATETSPHDILAYANMALNEAKRRGRNNVQPFVPRLREHAEARYRMVEGLRRAIEEGELALHYQPQIGPNGELIGAEALARWHSAQSGDVLPAAFIPLAEETGLIHALGEWTLKCGCEQLAAWERDGVPFRGHLSINVSPWQLARPTFVSRLRDIVAESGIDPHRIMLEITESAVLYDVGETVAKLKEIRPLGVRIALDDFGTGYSSLSIIKDLPLDAIKIDQSFVRNMGDGATKHLIRVIVAIGEELGLDVVAEGVETEADLETLQALGCRVLQGYLFCRPLGATQFASWLRDRERGPTEPGLRAQQHRAS
jgi:diguanylate cyclase (GGDEF)-like protein